MEFNRINELKRDAADSKQEWSSNLLQLQLLLCPMFMHHPFNNSLFIISAYGYAVFLNSNFIAIYMVYFVNGNKLYDYLQAKGLKEDWVKIK